ncbi:MAG: hypothetical protein ACI8RZ_002082 [Myxococcota bacterium]
MRICLLQEDIIMRIFLILPLLWACTDAKDSTEDSTTDSTEDTEIVAENGMPEGVSTWEGTIEASGVLFEVSVEITNTGGNLTAEADFEDTEIGYFGPGSYSLTGTHDPESGLFAFAPDDWLELPPHATPELVGFSGTYDPDGDVLTGFADDFASWDDNTLNGGPAELVWVSGDGAPTTLSSDDLALPETISFSGTHQCTGPVRELEGELTYDGSGGIEGSLTFGDPDFSDGSNTLDFTGVHNPDTGRITLIPGLYTDSSRSYLSFFVEAVHDPDAGTLNGEGRTGSGPCVAEGWNASY